MDSTQCHILIQFSNNVSKYSPIMHCENVDANNFYFSHVGMWKRKCRKKRVRYYAAIMS